MASDDQPDPEWEDPLPTLTGRAWAFGFRLRTHDILPLRHAGADPRTRSAHVFVDLGPAAGAGLAAGDVLVAHEVAGGDTDAEVAFAALARVGVTAVIATTFAPEILDAAAGAGMVLVALDAPGFIHTGDRVRIDLDAAKVVNLSSGDRAAIRHLDTSERAALRATLAKHEVP